MIIENSDMTGVVDNPDCLSLGGRTAGGKVEARRENVRTPQLKSGKVTDGPPHSQGFPCSPSLDQTPLSM